MENRDSFGLDAGAYLEYRPRYPRALYEHLAEVASAREAALDCATGNGQAAVDLARYFDRVGAFDTSAEQIAAAIPARNVEYRTGSAERLPFADRQFDLIAAAQAAHWFDLPVFYEQVNRVAKPGAVIAIWGYSYCEIDDDVDRIVESVLLGPIGPHWADGNKVIRERYRGIEFPFAELEWPRFFARHRWTREFYMQYLRTWSAVKKFALAESRDPVTELEAALEPVWPAATPRDVVFEIVGRIGRIDRS